MVSNLKKYSNYRDSGIAWLGKMPVQWEIKRHKDIFSFVNKKCDDVTLNKVGLENIESKTGKLIQTDSDFAGNGKEFIQNDILFGRLRPYLAKVYLAKTNGNAVGDFFVYRPLPVLIPKFASHLMLSSKYISIMDSTTVGAKMPRVSSDFIANLPVFLPPLPEQKAIAAYLDEKTKQIDQKIALLKQKAERYAELKQSLINETVTRGLDANVEMKESGVEWIGEIPAHWEVKRVKDIFQEESKNGYPDEPLLVASQNRGVILKSEYEKRTMTVQKNFHLLKLVEKGNYVISLRSFEGGIEIAHHRGIISSAYTVLSPLYSGGTGFYKNLFKSKKFISLLTTCTTGIREGQNISYPQLRRQFLPFPDSTERKLIADYLDEKTSKIEQIIEKINRQIEKLAELRKTLINDVVTGQIKVV